MVKTIFPITERSSTKLECVIYRKLDKLHQQEVDGCLANVKNTRLGEIGGEKIEPTLSLTETKAQRKSRLDK